MLHFLRSGTQGRRCVDTPPAGTLKLTAVVSAPPSMTTSAGVVEVLETATAKSKLGCTFCAVTVGKYSQPM